MSAKRLRYAAAVQSSRLVVLAWLRDRRRLLRRYRFLTIAARLASSSLIAFLISSRLCFGANEASAISRCSALDISVLSSCKMSDIQLLWGGKQRLRR